MTESKLQNRCKQYADDHGVLFRKLHCEGRRGWPDLMLMLPSSEVVWIEMKHPNGKGTTSKLQSIEHRRIRKHGGIVYVCESFEHFCGIIGTNL